jgi:hypothetical protein
MSLRKRPLVAMSTIDITPIQVQEQPIVAKKSRGANSFKSGNEYEQKCHSILQSITYRGEKLTVKPAAGATHDCDVICLVPVSGNIIPVGFEVKNLGAFEGGAKKLYSTPTGMTILEEGIHKSIIGDRQLYGGAILPWYQNKKTLEDWKAVEHIFKPDIYIETSHDSVANYYRKKGTYYIQIEGKGLYHTGEDILELGVPMLTSVVKMRIRSSKHIKNGIPMDITAALQFNRRTIGKSPYSLEGGQLPPCMTLC